MHSPHFIVEAEAVHDRKKPVFPGFQFSDCKMKDLMTLILISMHLKNKVP